MVTRITFQSIHRQTQNVLHRGFSELATLQQQVATGQRLLRPSDGEVDTANTLRLRTQVTQLKQYEKNINDGLAWMEITDTTTMSLNTIIQRARELALEGDNDTLSPAQRKFIADEVEQLTRQVVSLMNTRYKGEYIFSGSHTDKPSVILNESSRLDIPTNKMIYFDASAATAWDTSVTPAVGNWVQLWDPNGYGGNFNDPNSLTTPVRRIIPGSVEISANGMPMRENYEYKIDYITGEIQLLDFEGRFYPNLEDDGITFKPDHPMAKDFSNDPVTGNYNSANGIEIRMSYMSQSKDIYGANISTDSRIYRQIEDNVSIPINMTINDLAVDGYTDIFTSLLKLGEGLLYADSTRLNQSITMLDATIDKILSAQSTNGAMINRFDTTLERNEFQILEVNRLRSDIEEADYATAITQFAVKQTVFNAALNSTARIMQMSLIDYIR